MAEYFIHGDTGNDSNAGTAGSPWKTPVPFNTAKADGDIVNVAGFITADQSGFNINNRSNITIRQWAGQTQAKLFAVLDITGNTWTASDADTFTTTLAASPVSIVVAFENRLASTGIEVDCFLKKATSDANCIATPFTWWWAGGTLRVNIDGDQPGNPSFITVWACRSGGFPSTASGIGGTGCTNCVVDGLWMGLAPGATSEPYSVFMSGSGNVIRNVTSWYVARHHLGFVDSGTGLNTNNTIERCRMIGGAIEEIQGTQSVFYAAGNDVVNARVVDCEFRIYQARQLTWDPPGDYFGGTLTQDGGYSHTAGTTKVNSITYERCVFRNRLGGTNRWVAFGDQPTLPSGADALVTENWPGKVIDCTFINDGTAAIRNLGFAAYDRCTFQQGAVPVGTTTGINNYLLRSCFFSAATTTQGHILLASNNSSNRSTIYLVNCTLINSGNTGGSGLISFNGTGGTAVVVAYNNLFVCKQSGGTGEFLIGDANVAAGNLTFANNWYARVATSGWSDATARDTAAEWASVIESTAIQNVEPNLSSESAPAAPTIFGNLWSSPNDSQTFDTEGVLGINGRQFEGDYGAWASFGEYGTGGGSSTGGRRIIPLFMDS
jgi:hypothetical protein